MTTRAAFLICAIARLGLAGSPVSFQTHYIASGSQDSAVAIAADAAGEIFIVSSTGLAAHSPAIHVTKTDPLGNVVAVLDLGQGVIPTGAAVDAQGNLVITGNRFVAKIDNALANILATTSIAAAVSAVTTDASGNIYIAGSAAGNFPTTPGVYEGSGSPMASYGLVAELSSDLSQILTATLYGSSAADCNPVSAQCRQANGPGLPASTTATSIAIDPSGSVVIAGYSNGAQGPLSAQPYNYGFAAKFSADLTVLSAQMTFNPPGIRESSFRAMTLDAQGNVFVVGDGFGTGTLPGSALQPMPPGSDGGGFVLMLDTASETILWGTYFGDGSPGQAVEGVAVDSQGDVWITGYSQLGALPDAASSSIATLPFVAELTGDGSTVLNLLSSQFGGAAITVVPNGGPAVLGATDSFLLAAAPDQPALLMVANSANNQSCGTIAPAELISLYGAGIGPASPFGGVVVNGGFTESLGGYQVLFNGVPAPLLYAGPDQFNVVSPAAIAGQQTAQIEVAGPLGSMAFPTVFVSAVRPQLFSQQLPDTIDPVPVLRTYAIAINQDGSLNSAANPAARGSIVTLWATGTGLADDLWPDGAIVGPAASVNLPVVVLDSNGNSLAVSYAGQAPGAVLGLTQINVQVPSNAQGIGSGGAFPFLIFFQMGGASTGTALIEVSSN